MHAARAISVSLLALVAAPKAVGQPQRPVEEAALGAFSAACLSDPIAEREIPRWAASTGARSVVASEYADLVLGKHKDVWQVPEANHRIYVALGEKLGCSVWFVSNDHESAIEAFRERVKLEISRLEPGTFKTEIFKDGPVSPSLWSLSFVTRFQGIKTGLMWAVYVSEKAGAKAIWYTASRVRVEA